MNSMSWLFSDLGPDRGGKQRFQVQQVGVFRLTRTGIVSVQLQPLNVVVTAPKGRT